jgi:ketosteroid isomerase-like protein
VDSDCIASNLTPAVKRFFDAWNARDRAALGQVFTSDATLDMSLKGQHGRAASPTSRYTTGLGRDAIVALAARQWSEGGRMSHGNVEAFEDGGYVKDVVARFQDGTQQRMSEAKFAYDCRRQAFSHVVMIADGAAQA